MFQDKTILAIVPARGGSKGVPLKNIQPVLGVPLVARVGYLIKKVAIIDRAVVSTDHPQIAKVASQAGLDVPFMRPTELSGDKVADWDVLIHTLLEMEKLDCKTYDVIVMLQPTSPLRKPEYVFAAIQKLVMEKYDSVWTVSLTDPKYHPLKQLTLKNDKIDYYDPEGKKIIARQQLMPLYHRNGVAYVMTRECLVNQRTIKGENTGALVINEEMVSIDTLRDFKVVEFLLKEKG